ncbi:hypothetical protein Clacol_010054 [Clathrus columnatus]|uniref:HPt domain-containing protein n=1 Tax=Clathrus columnatus TaxID=1419009 RepID=A0AAV5ASN7_9AGAM|nr:hypothetical protein Clacol_010054 [Clathrus columnatus]
MATAAVKVKESTVSPPSSPRPRAKSKSKSVEPEPERKPEPKLKTPEPDDKQREPTPSPAKTTTESKESILDRQDIIDMEVLDQILELDEPDNHEFSMGMAWAYFDQAKTTFDEMDAALLQKPNQGDPGQNRNDKDLPKLSSLGHFLKGSSAALGITKVRESCESIQHYGELRDGKAQEILSEKDALNRIRETVENAKNEFDEAEEWLRRYYEVNAPNEEPPSI